MTAYPFVQARNYTQGRSCAIDVLVVHTMESPEKPDTAESVASWFAGPTAPQASAHYCIDEDSIVQCVRDEDVAWHAPGANHNGLGFEHAGTAQQDRADWSDAYTTAMLDLSAGLLAAKCRQYHVPVVWLSVADLLAGKRGITSHANVSAAFKRSDHTDPGSNFPVDRYLALVNAKLGAAPAPAKPVVPAEPAPAEPVQAAPPTARKGDHGWTVKKLQTLLTAAGFDPQGVDGDFGPNTEAVLRAFQQAKGLAVDGVAGPQTWQALLPG